MGVQCDGPLCFLFPTAFAVCISWMLRRSGLTYALVFGLGLLIRPSEKLFMECSCFCISCRYCGTKFSICRSCFRGQSYCSSSCRKGARHRIVREAGRKYSKTSIGRESHKKRQRKYRAKSKVEKSETHLSSETYALTVKNPESDRIVTTAPEGVFTCVKCGAICDLIEGGFRAYQMAWSRRRSDKAP